MNLFEKPPVKETDVAERLGVTRQTLRNWRRGRGAYPAKLVEGEHWWKHRQHVVFAPEWVEQMEYIHNEKKELLK